MSVAFDAMYVMVGFWGAMVGLVQGSVFVVGYGLLEACIQVALGSRNALPSKESARALPELESKTGVDKEDQKDFDDNFQLAAGAIVAENGNHVQDAEDELLEQAAVAPEQTEGDEEGEQYDMEPATRALVFVDDEIEEFFEESRPLEAVEEAEELAGVSEDAADVAADVNDAVADVEEDTTQQDTEDSTTAPEGFCKVMFDSAGVATVVMLPQPVAETFAAAEVDDMPEAEPTVAAEAGSDAEMVSKVYFGNSGSAHVMLLPMPPKLGEDEEQVEEMEEKEQLVEEVAMQPNESRSLHVNGTVEAIPLPMVRALSEPDLGPARKEGDLKLADKVADVLEVLEDAIPADKKSMLDTAYNEDVHAVDGTASSGSVQQEVEAGEEKEGQVEELDGGLRQAPREEPVSAPTKAKKGAFFGLACCMVRPSRVRD